MGRRYRERALVDSYLRARYYDPSTAQFISRDPISSTTRQPYSYVYVAELSSAIALVEDLRAGNGNAATLDAVAVCSGGFGMHVKEVGLYPRAAKAGYAIASAYFSGLSLAEHGSSGPSPAPGHARPYGY